MKPKVAKGTDAYATRSCLSRNRICVMLNLKNRTGGNRMGKRIAFPGSYYDTIRFEKWLSKCAAQGLQFYTFSNRGKIPEFHEQEPQQVRYYVEPDFDQYTPEEMEKVYTDLGWTFVDELRGTCLVYKTEELWASKPQGRFEEKAWSKKWRKLLLGQIGIFFLELLSIYLLLKPFFDLSTLYEHGTKEFVAVIALLLFSGILILQNIWPWGANIYDIHAWNRCIRMGEETEEWRGIVILRWGEVVLFWLIIISLPLLFLTILPIL